MTITATTSRWAYSGNGVTTAFAYTNRIFAASDLKVYLSGVLQTAGFTVSNVGVQTGGNVTFALPPANDTDVVIVRDVPATQDIDYVANDPFPAATHEKGLDKLTILAQQLASRLPRTLQLADGDPAAPFAALPAKAALASKFLAFDAMGEPVAAASVVNAPVSPFINTLLDDADAATALTTLGVSAYARTLLEDSDAVAARATLGVTNGIDVRHLGAVGDGVTDDRPAFAAAPTERLIEVPPGSYRIAASATWSSGRAWLFHPGARLVLDAGVTLTIRGIVDAGPTQIFAGAGNVVGIRRARPEWWGAVGNGTADDQPALQKCHDCVEASQASNGDRQEIILRSAKYGLGRTFRLRPSWGVSLRMNGAGTGGGGTSFTALSSFAGGSDVFSRAAIQIEGQSDENISANFDIGSFCIIAEVGTTAEYGMCVGGNV